ncbi:ATP-binding protein [Streptomyces albipurpureus]|uniref:ATP-binding protein n=1 Tax=Streptomyces albipurpureus TaxID=2897419 RepID=A0ABT0UVG4_9ACTN|nr:ATP-binding protein [Streptomyces sp. CWNU-1]MCM2392577.1 ATP-binding protein [Streptomyces sp. CWNU-1]
MPTLRLGLVADHQRCPENAASRTGYGFHMKLTRTTLPGEYISDTDGLIVGEMRRTALEQLEQWSLDALADRVELAVSELVTNAFRHGVGPSVKVCMWRTDRVVCVEVANGRPDASSDFVQRDVNELAENGRGLLLVAAVSDAIGLSPDHFRIWCSFALGGDRHCSE